jgi:hypothetical protein
VPRLVSLSWALECEARIGRLLLFFFCRMRSAYYSIEFCTALNKIKLTMKLGVKNLLESHEL